MSITSSRMGYREYIRVELDPELEASPTVGDIILVSDLDVSFEQGATFKEYVEKGIDRTIYVLGGTTLVLNFTANLKSKEAGPYKLIEKANEQFKERGSIEPTTFTVYISYYGTLHGCVIESINMDAQMGGTITINFVIIVRYLDFTTRQMDQTNIDSPSEMLRNYMFYDISLKMEPTYDSFYLPSDEAEFSNVMTSFTLNVSNEIQKNWTLSIDDDIGDDINPQKITAPKDIAMGGREIDGTISYLMPHDDLHGFYKVLENTSSLLFFLEDKLDIEEGETEWIELYIEEPVFLIPSRPITTQVLNQTATFRAIRRKGYPYETAIRINIKE